MKEAVVTDSTCLIALDRIGQLDLLAAVFEPIYAPREVALEFGISLTWLKVVDLADPDRALFLSASVDAGEAEAIALGRELGLKVILDDLRARRLAQRLGIEVLGTLGILVRAKKNGILSHLGPTLDLLETCGFRMTRELKDLALLQAGEGGSS